ncbi:MULTISPECIES: hypothetical protein [unclassified Solwaraspora]|uniref:hypothetical protein n=1 Tax=unclassified Solwaraspora TaxID=2627926 RepID=UPI00259B16EF|nr:hypothetical protein [Solwaraspora sp. WMMA2056]WJK38777.1 hypothetical protein O7608_20010 [Solwaraspora sp. WMMA2056]
MAEETFTVTDSYLNSTVRRRFEAFLAEAKNDPDVKRLLAYTGQPPAPADDAPFSVLLAGNENVLTEVGQVETAFATLADGAKGNVAALFDLIEQLRDDFLEAKETLDIGSNDALTASQMLDLVRDVWQPVPNLRP